MNRGKTDGQKRHSREKLHHVANAWIVVCGGAARRDFVVIVVVVV
jgi:hypothetical protein